MHISNNTNHPSKQKNTNKAKTLAKISSKNAVKSQNSKYTCTSSTPPSRRARERVFCRERERDFRERRKKERERGRGERDLLAPLASGGRRRLWLLAVHNRDKVREERESEVREDGRREISKIRGGRDWPAVEAGARGEIVPKNE